MSEKAKTHANRAAFTFVQARQIAKSLSSPTWRDDLHRQFVEEMVENFVFGSPPEAEKEETRKLIQNDEYASEYSSELFWELMSAERLICEKNPKPEARRLRLMSPKSAPFEMEGSHIGAIQTPILRSERHA